MLLIPQLTIETAVVTAVRVTALAHQQQGHSGHPDQYERAVKEALRVVKRLHIAACNPTDDCALGEDTQCVMPVRLDLTSKCQPMSKDEMTPPKMQRAQIPSFTQAMQFWEHGQSPPLGSALKEIDTYESDKKPEEQFQAPQDDEQCPQRHVADYGPESSLDKLKEMETNQILTDILADHRNP